MAGRPAPVDVDMSWCMGEGPGRYYNPGMFPIIGQIADNRHLAPGTYNLRDFVPNGGERHPSLTARMSNYSTDMRSADYPLRALVFGNESAKILARSKSSQTVPRRSSKSKFDPGTRTLILSAIHNLS